MITVILPFKTLHSTFARGLLGLSKIVKIVCHGSDHLLFGDAAYAGIVWSHGYVLQIVEFAEDAELRELGDAREEDKMQIWVAVFQRRIEIAHHIAQHGQCLVFMHHIKQRSIIFINENDHLLARLFIYRSNKVS